MFRFFALPDYSFQDLKLPAWAYNKRRSPLYVRPGVQVSSTTEKVSLSGNVESTGTMSMPAGDDYVEPFDDANASTKPSTDKDEEPLVSSAVLINSTVMHSYSATKERYKFKYNGANALSDNNG